MGFSGYWICLIWRLRFGILKQNRARFWNESMRGMWDAENNHQDYWIERKFGSRLRDWAEIWVKMTFRALRWRGLSTILHNIQREASFRLSASGSPAWKVYYTTYKFQTAIAPSWKILFIIVCVQRVFFIVCLTVVGSKPVNHEWGWWYANQ